MKALITGGARGIGAQCAIELANKGYTVYITYNTSKEDALTLTKYGITPVQCDITKPEAIEDLKNIVGDVDVLVNNAGIASQKLFIDVTLDDWDTMFNTNVRGAFLTTKAFVNGMIHNKRGKIINISSIWGETGGSCEVAYSASKGAIIAFTKALAKELGPSNIQVNCVSPGLIDTKMNAHLSSEDIEEIIEDEIPLMRIGTPNDIAKTVAFLASDDASYITGEVIKVNGGMYI